MNKNFEDMSVPCPYDNSWLVKIAENIGSEEKLIAEIKNLNTVIGFCSCGCGDPYFIDPESSDWDFDGNIVLHREDGISIILDVMKDGRIGHIEIGEWDKKK